jgi:hypothetical protein
MQPDTPPPPEPLAIPTVFHWQNFLLAFACVGLAAIFAYVIVITHQRIDRETGLLEEKREKLDRRLVEVEQKQALYGEPVRRIPLLGDMITALQRDVAEHGAVVKLIEVQGREIREELTQMRRTEDELRTRINELTYVRQPKIPLPEPRQE